MSEKSIGNLNGKWSLLLRIALATYPFLLTWCVWVTKENFANYWFRTGDSYVKSTDAAAIKEELVEKINASPSPEWRARILVLEQTQATMATDIASLKTMSIEHKRILERIEDSLVRKGK